MFVYVVTKQYLERVKGILKFCNRAQKKWLKEMIENGEIQPEHRILYLKNHFSINYDNCIKVYTGTLPKDYVKNKIQTIIKIKAGQAHFKIEGNFFYIDDKKLYCTNNTIGNEYATLPIEVLWRRLNAI